MNARDGAKDAACLYRAKVLKLSPPPVRRWDVRRVGRLLLVENVSILSTFIYSIDR